MKPTANVGAELPFLLSLGAPPGSGEAADPHRASHAETADAVAEHDPDAKALLRRYLAEIHSFREMGNQALRNLEARLAGRPDDGEEGAAPASQEAGRSGAGSQLVKPLLPRAEGKARSADPTLTDRLSELSAYLHADLSREGDAGAEQVRQPRRRRRAHFPAQWGDGFQRGQGGHKIPTLPVLDRAWFEGRFAALRASIEKVVEEVPLKRIEKLEGQFRELMDRLTQREEARDPRPLEASLRELATYLADSRQWQVANEQRVLGMENRLDRLSDLVAQSHAAISATAKGLEVVAKGTGDNLARATASLIVAKLGEKIDESNPGERIDELGRQVAQLTEASPAEHLEKLGRDVAHLTAQSRMISRNTEDRLERIENVLRDRTRPVIPATSIVPVAQPGAAEPRRSSHDELETYLTESPAPNTEDDDYDSDMIAAAQRAARLADNPARHAPAGADPVRYQIPYGEFLPDDDGNAPRAGLVVAVVILLLAGVVMLFLKAKEWTLVEPQPAAMLEERSAPPVAAAEPAAPAAVAEKAAGENAPQDAASEAPRPVVTGSTPAAPVPGSKPFELWVATKAPDAAGPAQNAASEAPAPASAEPSFREAAVKGDAGAQFSVGQSYLSGGDGETHLSGGDRLSKAVRWFRRAAEGGHAPSQYRLATLYELGQGTARDLTEAEKWYEAAARQGHVKAMHNLAVLAVSPARGSVNYLSAAKWFQEAAGYGLVDSQYNVGVLHERGLGVPRSQEDAYFWYALAARQKDEKAVQKRDELARLLPPAQRVAADRRAAAWSPKRRSEEVNRLAPEPPVTAETGEKPATPSRAAPPVAQAAVLQATWKTDLAFAAKSNVSTARIADAQRLLKQMGFDPGPVDGVPGPRTVSAVRLYQRRAGLEPTGEITESLIVKMAFLPL